MKESILICACQLSNMRDDVQVVNELSTGYGCNDATLIPLYPTDHVIFKRWYYFEK